MSFSSIVLNFLLCRFETIAGWIDVHAQFNGGEPQRLKVRCLGVTFRGLKDELNEFNQGVNPRDTRRVEYVWYKRSTKGEYHSVWWINERRRRDEHVLGAQHVTVDRYVCNVTEINRRYSQQFDSARRS